jgi:hypothetical protein
VCLCGCGWGGFGFVSNKGSIYARAGDVLEQFAETSRLCIFNIYLYIFIYLLTAIGLLPGGSTHLHTNNI